MSFLEVLTKYWSIILFVGGGLFNLGYVYSSVNTMKTKREEDLREIEKDFTETNKRINELETDAKSIRNDFNDVKGDLKSINAKLDLLINNKIK